MSRWLKQSTAVDLPIGPFLDETDGKTAETALTLTQPDIRLKKNGGNWAQKNAAQTLSHEENGWYEVSLDTTDTNTLGCLELAVHESGALPVWCEFMVLPANVWDSFFGADALQVHAVEIANDLITAASIAADAIGSSELAATAVNEIADQVWDEALSGHQSAGSTGEALSDAGGAAIGSSPPTAAHIADAVWDEPLSGHLTVSTFGQAAQPLRTGTAQSGSAAGTIVLDAGASASNDYYNYQVIRITSGTGAGQARWIADYVGSTKTATIYPNWVTTPSNTSVFVIDPKGIAGLSPDERDDMAAAILAFDQSTISPVSDYSLLNAIRALRNWEIEPGSPAYLVVKDENGVEVWRNVITFSGNDPVSSSSND
jgi:hypothetical protein